MKQDLTRRQLFATAGAGGSADDEGKLVLAAAHIAPLGGVVHDGVRGVGEEVAVHDLGHGPQAVQAMRAGKHVYSAVPSAIIALAPA